MEITRLALGAAASLAVVVLLAQNHHLHASPLATSGPISDQQLQSVALNLGEFGPRYSDFVYNAASSGFKTAQDRANQSCDPEVGASLISHGYVNGYDLFYRASDLDLFFGETDLLVATRIYLFDDADGAAAEWDPSFNDDEMGELCNDEIIQQVSTFDLLGVGDEAIGAEVTYFLPEPGVTVYGTWVLVRRGPIIAGVVVGRLTEENSRNEVAGWANILDSRIQSVLPAQPAEEDRKVIFIQGIDSQSGPCGYGEHFRGRVAWMRDQLLQDASLSQSVPSLDSENDFFYFSYSGGDDAYCKDDGQYNYHEPSYVEADTCDGVLDAAMKLDDLVNALISPGVTFDLITHSMGGMVASYWASWESLGKPLVDAGRVNSIVTFDSPLRGLPNKNPATSACDEGTQSWRDLHCNDFEQATNPQACESEVVWKIQSVAASVPFYTIDSTQLDIIPINVEFVPRNRTTFTSSNSELHCQFDDDHTSVWGNGSLGGGDLVSCWKNFSWTDNPPQPTKVWGTPSTKGTFVSCAIAAVTGADCMERLGDIVIPNASVSSFTPAGSNVVEIAGQSGLFVGDHILINPGMPNEEEKQVSGFGSLILSSPLVYDHEAGESIVRLSSGTIPSPMAVVWGDANCSGSANPVDSLLTLRHDAGLSANTGSCPEMGVVVDVQNASPHPWGDVDCGGDVTPVDSLKLLRYDAGLSVAQEASCPVIGSEILVVE